MGDLGRELEEDIFGTAGRGLGAVAMGCVPGPGVVTPGESSPAIADVDWD